MNKIKKRITLLSFLITICGCSLLDFNTSTSTSTSSAQTNTTSSSIDRVQTASYGPLQQRLDDDPDFTVGIPSIGDVKVLVIPVQIGNDSFTFTELNKLELAFNGTSEETGFESVNSYYKKASNNLLNITADITPVYKTNKTKNYYETLYNNGEDIEYSIIKGALTSLNSSYNFDDYDSNLDGYIDGIYLVYSTTYSTEEGSPWWAWCYEYFTDNYEYYDSVEADYYVWGSIDFLNDRITSTKRIDVNAETFIHETGHMLGLDDYYDYNLNKGAEGGIGGAAMMDYNVGDHDSFSKAMMGWTNHTVIEESGTYSLKPSVENNEFLIIPLRDYDNVLFNEYLLIDYFTPTSLNSVQKGHNGLFSVPGVRIYHIDSRIDPNVGTPKNDSYDEASQTYGYFTIFSFNNSDTEHKLISLIEKDGNNSIISTEFASNSDLFFAGDKLKGITNHSSITKDITVTIDSITAENATVTILID